MATRKRSSKRLGEEIGKAGAYALVEQETYLNLLRTQAVLSREFELLFRAHGLSDPQYNALAIAGSAGREGIRSEQIGRRMVALDPDTTRLIDRLVRRGLVERKPLESDRRCVVVVATRAGRELLRRLEPKVLALHREQLGHMRRRDLEELGRLLALARQR